MPIPVLLVVILSQVSVDWQQHSNIPWCCWFVMADTRCHVLLWWRVDNLQLVLCFHRSFKFGTGETYNTSDILHQLCKGLFPGSWSSSNNYSSSALPGAPVQRGSRIALVLVRGGFSQHGGTNPFLLQQHWWQRLLPPRHSAGLLLQLPL